MNSSNILLGEYLLDVGMITAEQLNSALEIQQVTKSRIGEILVNEGYIKEEEIIKVLELKLGIPYVKLDTYGVDQEACMFVPEAISRKYILIPIKKDNKILVVAMSDPLNVYAIDDLRIISGMEIQPVLALKEEILSAIPKYYGAQKAIKALQDYVKDKNLLSLPDNLQQDENSEGYINNAPIVKLINTILEQAIRSNASDIHIEPYENNVKVRYRIDGHLKEVMQIDSKVLNTLLARIKIIGNMNISEKRLPQDGKISIEVEGKTFDLRVSIIPIVFGEKIVMRIIDKSSFLISKENLGFGQTEILQFDRILKNPHGLILVTGPTGSGKSTTLYSAIQELKKADVNIVTIEDPIESVVEGIGQIQANPKVGLDFATGLRAILRQDPDIIMIGEIRDSETAQIAVRSAITGHLVLSTLHTNDAPSSITRLIDMGIEPFLVASSLVGVVAQRLLRKICPNCKTKYAPTSEDIELLGSDSQIPEVIYKGRGCPVCLGTGYKGRIGVYEVLEMSKQHRQMINSGANDDELREYSIKYGMQTIKESTAKLVRSGMTTTSEMKRIAYSNN